MWRVLAILWCAAGLWAAQSAGDPATFAGTLRDSVTSRPVARGSVRLTAIAAGQPGYAGATDTTGAFRFEAVRPGDYRIELRQPGYLDRSTLLRLGAGQALESVALDMEPLVTITGVVTDADGDPVAGAEVSALASVWKRGMRRRGTAGRAETDDRGVYRLRLRAGRYFLAAAKRGSDVYVEEPGGPETRVGEVQQASAVEVTPGQQVQGADFRLPAVRVYRVRGLVQPPPADTAELWVVMHNRDDNRAFDTARSNSIRKGGSFEVPGVKPGQYRLAMFAPNGRRPHGEIDLDVADGNLNTVILPVAGPFEMRGSVRLEDGGSPPPPLTMRLERLEPWFDFRVSTSTAEGGTFEFRDAPEGEFVLDTAAPAAFYVKSVSVNHRDAPSGRFHLNGPAEVEVLLGADTCQVEGGVKWPDTMPPVPLPSYMAVVVSAAGVTGNTGVRAAQIDAGGRFRLEKVPPGRYLVWAVAQFNQDMWQDMEFVEQVKARAATVEVPPKGSATVTAPILSDDDLQRALAGLP